MNSAVYSVNESVNNLLNNFSTSQRWNESTGSPRAFENTEWNLLRSIFLCCSCVTGWEERWREWTGGVGWWKIRGTDSFTTHRQNLHTVALVLFKLFYTIGFYFYFTHEIVLLIVSYRDRWTTWTLQKCLPNIERPGAPHVRVSSLHTSCTTHLNVVHFLITGLPWPIHCPGLKTSWSDTGCLCVPRTGASTAGSDGNCGRQPS